MLKKKSSGQSEVKKHSDNAKLQGGIPPVAGKFAHLNQANKLDHWHMGNQYL